MATFHLVVGHAQVVGGRRPTQGELRSADGAYRKRGRHRRRQGVGGEAVDGRIGRSSISDNIMRLVASIGPGGKVLSNPSQKLGRDGTHRIHGSQDDGTRKGGERAATPDNQLQARGI